MADTIKIKAGNKRDIPRLAAREIAYCKDEEALYVGTPEGNVRVKGITSAERTEIVNDAVTKALEEFAKLNQTPEA